MPRAKNAVLEGGGRIEEFKVIETCFSCGDKFQMGPHVYGEYIPLCKISVCTSCFNANWDEWGPMVDKKLVEHLQAMERPVPKRTKRGWLPRGK